MLPKQAVASCLGRASLPWWAGGSSGGPQGPTLQEQTERTAPKENGDQASRRWGKEGVGGPGLPEMGLCGQGPHAAQVVPTLSLEGSGRQMAAVGLAGLPPLGVALLLSRIWGPLGSRGVGEQPHFPRPHQWPWSLAAARWVLREGSSSHISSGLHAVPGSDLKSSLEAPGPWAAEPSSAGGLTPGR